jgi:hypothetical protein
MLALPYVQGVIVFALTYALKSIAFIHTDRALVAGTHF